MNLLCLLGHHDPVPNWDLQLGVEKPDWDARICFWCGKHLPPEKEK